MRSTPVTAPTSPVALKKQYHVDPRWMMLGCQMAVRRQPVPVGLMTEPWRVHVPVSVVAVA